MPAAVAVGVSREASTETPSVFTGLQCDSLKPRVDLRYENDTETTLQIRNDHAAVNDALGCLDGLFASGFFVLDPWDSLCWRGGFFADDRPHDVGRKLE